MLRNRIGPARQFARAAVVVSTLLVALFAFSSTTAAKLPIADTNAAGDYVVLAWNDLGMHCYNPDFQDLAVLPPYNTLWAQVIRVGDPPELITSDVNVSFLFEDNTYSVGKTNFWDYEDQLFGVDLPPNVGLTGIGLAGAMTPEDGYFIAEGIPLTEFSDSAPAIPAPYQVATVIVTDATTNEELARTHPVAPVSTEMHCDNCHFDGGVGGIATGRVETNILTLHDEEVDEYPPGHEGPLMDRRPILCAECHATNALGAPGVEGVPNLSKAIHSKHNEAVPNTLEGCYNCHPGPTTQCLRDVMSTEHSMDCVDCHGTMEDVAENPDPWLNEPRCDACHSDPGYEQNEPLYRMSFEHGDIYCAGCHDSPHAIAPSREPNDQIKFLDLQGTPGTLATCTVCHATAPTAPGPHGILPEEMLATLYAQRILKGTLAGGNLASLLASDDNYLMVTSVLNQSGSQHLTTTLVGAHSPTTDISRLYFALEVASSRGGTRGSLWLFNFDSSAWEQIGSLPLPLSDSVRVTPDVPNPNRYVRDSDGLIGLQIRTSANATGQPIGHTVRVDLVEVRVAP